MIRFRLALAAAFIAALVAGDHARSQSILANPPPTPAGLSRVLGSLRGANFNTTADQAIPIPGSIAAFQVTSILVTNCSANLTLAAGGFYPAASKAGTPLVAAVQVYTALSASTVVLPATLAAGANTTRFTLASIFLSLTTGQGSAATCDVYIVGVDLT